MRVYILSFVLIALFVLPGCTQSEKRACSEVDWYQIGRRDGAVGKTEDYFQKYNNYCREHERSQAQSLYFHGREAGLSIFCEPNNAFELGHAGVGYDHVCPLEYQDSFLVHYNRGLRFREIEKSNLSITLEVRKLNNQLEQPTLSEEIRQSLVKKVRALESELKINQNKLSQIEGSSLTR